MTDPTQDKTHKSRLLGRNGEVWLRYVRSQNQQSIADELGISQAQVSRILKKVRDEIPQETKEDLVRRGIEQLDYLTREALKLVEAAPIPAYSQGRPILLDDGETVAEDHSGRMKAAAEARACIADVRKMCGLDMPTQSQVSSEGTVRFEVVGVDLDAIE